MTTFRSCHLIINRIIPDDCRHAHKLIDAHCFVGEVLMLHF